MDVDNYNKKQIGCNDKYTAFVAIAAHKKVRFPKIPYHYPVCVGAYKNRWDSIDEKVFYDDEGSNISQKNNIYNELTAHYWMYKNIDADYYGLCHYRRYFNYNTKKQRPPRVACCWITDHLTQKYFWNKTAIKDVIANYDILLACAEPGAAKPGVKSIWDFNMEVGNEQHYSLLMRCIQEYSPEYYPFAKRYFNGTNEHMFNMFIMKKKEFLDYSKWLFGLLDMVENELALKHILIDRSCGYFGEHLLNIFALYQQEENKKRIGSLQTVMILSTSDDLPLNEKIKAVFKKIFTIFFPYGSQRRDMIKWIFVMKG